MKRIIASLLILVLCFSCASVLAEEPAELTYMDIPWYSTPEEVSAILVDAKFIPKARAFGEKDVNTFGSLPEMKEKYGVACMPSNIAADPSDQECPYAYNLGKNSWDKFPPLTRKLSTIFLAAGIKGKFANSKISSLALYFTPDEENRQLVECQIGCKQAKQEDILAVLEEAYGKSYTSKYKEYIWLGANNTIIIYFARKGYIVFATIDGLNLAESYDIQVPE